MDINRKIQIGTNFIDGIENDNPQEFFVNGNKNTLELENEYNNENTMLRD